MYELILSAKYRVCLKMRKASRKKIFSSFRRIFLCENSLHFWLILQMWCRGNFKIVYFFKNGLKWAKLSFFKIIISVLRVYLKKQLEINKKLILAFLDKKH